jgi:hypothetical protein
VLARRFLGQKTRLSVENAELVFARSWLVYSGHAQRVFTFFSPCFLRVNMGGGTRPRGLPLAHNTWTTLTLNVPKNCGRGARTGASPRPLQALHRCKLHRHSPTRHGPSWSLTLRHNSEPYTYTWCTKLQPACLRPRAHLQPQRVFVC